MISNTGVSINHILRQNFSIRLLDLLANNGYKNNRRPYYIDIPRFAEDIDVNPTMLRRYLSGAAIPQPHIVEKAASLLNVDPLWLYCGYEEPCGIDNELLKQILLKMKNLLSQKSSPSKFKSIIESTCDIYNRIYATQVKNELEKKKLITWMVNGIIKELKLNKSSAQPIKKDNKRA